MNDAFQRLKSRAERFPCRRVPASGRLPAWIRLLPLLALAICLALSQRCVPLDPGPDDEAGPFLTGLLGAVSTNATSGAQSARALDRGDGTVTDTLQNLVWAKCPQSSAAGANLYGGGGAGDGCAGAAATTQYCASADDSCNGGASPGILDGGGTSTVYQSCDNLSLGGRSDWRVPTYPELATLIFAVYATESALFPNTNGHISESYWTATALGSTNAAAIDFTDQSIFFQSKLDNYLLRCVAD
ncbi:MAG: DUF1566 domain-containing protein [bacterium]|nr:DUF1566 domain-containing protein [bacterium]